MARKRQNSLEPTDLKQLLTDTLLLLEREMNKYHIRVEVFAQAVPPVLADGNQIQQVLLNMLVNARQAMPRGGRIVIRLQHDPDSPFVDLQIRDFGTGIPPEILPRIFDPFFTTKTGPDASGKGGSGLGLSACRDIIEAHNGRIRVESAVGKGTCFTIRLPVMSRADHAEPRPSEEEPSKASPSSPAAPVFSLAETPQPHCPTQGMPLG
jgi:signal transduction histidine kinase